MNHCTECNFPLDDDMLVCPQCGAEVRPPEEGQRTVSAGIGGDQSPIVMEDTVNLSEEPERGEATAAGDSDVMRTVSSAGNATVDYEGPEADLELDPTHQAATTSAESPGSETVVAPGVTAGSPGPHPTTSSSDSLPAVAEASDETNQTVEAGLTELDEADDFDFDDDLPGVRSDAGDAASTVAQPRATVQAGDQGDRSDFAASGGDNQHTIQAAGPAAASSGTSAAGGSPATGRTDDSQDKAVTGSQQTVDFSSEDRPAPPAAQQRATVDATAATGDQRDTRTDRPAPVESGNDAAGTVVLPGNVPSAPAGEKTVVYESHQAGSSTVQASGTSGTEGRLKRLWEGVAGSSENPMHSLQAVGLQASDSVFQRVALRRVADAGTAEDITADYQIVDKLGEGAMGIVFSARQTAVNRIVAIKTAKPSFQNNDESRRRFLYEAHITADLDHSNIVPIHELGASEEGMLFYSMKLVQGTEWSRVMRKKTREQNLEIFMKVTDAMAFAHSKGVVHRDLKPENTMLGRFGEVFVTDWGTAINLEKDTTHLAKPANKGDKSLTLEDASNFARGDSLVIHDGYDAYDRVQILNFDEVNPNRIYLRKKLTRDYQPSRRLYVLKAMTLAGTPCYMAPEMAGHQLPKIGKTSDIYILGAILYDLVTGKPPHTGDSVTQCLRAALQNEIIKTDADDALLSIAYKAMATDPAQRYQTVEELQEAVREYSRHAESIALSDRSDELVTRAIANRDYQAFSRALFGYRDAIDLWPDNTAADSGLKKGRLAFGEAAFAKGDYDLVVQTLDCDVPEEANLYAQAVKAKRKAEEREKSLRLLKRAVAAVVLIAITGLSGLAWLANSQKNIAVAQRNIAQVAVEQERQAKLKEAEARNAAELSAKAAKLSAEEALIAQGVAITEKMNADAARIDAENSAKIADEQRLIAEKNQKAEEAQRRVAEAQTELAKRRAAQIQLGEYNSSLALAKSQIESFDLASGSQNLGKLAEMFGGLPPAAANERAKAPGAAATAAGNDDAATSSDVFFGSAPKIDTWGWRRIQLLGNLDLPTASITSELPADTAASLASEVTASAFAAASNLAAVGTRQGLVQILRYQEGDLQLARSLVEPGAQITALAIAPDGSEVVYGYTRDKESGVKRWDPQQSIAQDVVSTGKRSFQRFSYTSNGEQLLGGISGGIWIWNRATDWYAQSEPTARIGIRGELTNLQPLDSQHSLLTTRFIDRGQSKVLIGLLNHQSREIQLVDVDKDIAARLHSAAHTLINNQVLLGLNDNRLLLATLLPGATQLTQLTELETIHRAPVAHIVTDGIDQVVTASDSEPVAHVWRFQAKQQAWEYDSYLTGTPRNLAAVGVLQQSQVLAVDALGTAIVWDVERQKQRRRLERETGDEQVEYNAPVQAVVAGASDGRAIAIDAEGVVDLWNLTNGQTTRIDGNRWSYFGHTPGAELVNSAIDLQRGVVVTAASLQFARKAYLQDASHAWEFCVWDANSGEMLKRWSAPHRQLQDRSETIEQRISLVDQGRQILFASDSETRLVDLETGQETFVRDDFGSYFAVPHPHQTDLMMLVKRSGAIRLLTVRQPASWLDPRMRNFSLADPSDIPLQGIWTEDGSRFYLTFSSGGLAVFSWDGAQLNLAWSSRSLTATPATEQLTAALKVTGGRVQSHLDVDLGLQPSDSGETLFVATRKRGSNPNTQLVAVRFQGQGTQPTLMRNTNQPLVGWLQMQGSQSPQISERIHDVLIVDASRVRSRVKVNNRIFVSTTGAQVLELAEGQPQVISYGRSKLISASGTRDGSMLIALLEDGSLWKFVAGKSVQEWSRLDHTALGATQIQLAPDGKQMLIVNQGQGTVVQTESGQVIREVGAVGAASWDPDSADRLAVAHPDGALEIWSGEQSHQLAEQPRLAAGAQLVGVSFFNEVWEDADQPPRQFLLVQSETDVQGTLQFIPIDPPPADIADDQPEVEVIPAGSRVAVSPTENIIVTGAPGGTVGIWFATPTHNRRPHHLFDLEGHRGEDITCLAFSSDGQTIVTADSKNRLYAWLSSDPLVGK